MDKDLFIGYCNMCFFSTGAHAASKLIKESANLTYVLDFNPGFDLLTYNWLLYSTGNYSTAYMCLFH